MASKDASGGPELATAAGTDRPTSRPGLAPVDSADDRRSAPAAERNRDAVARALADLLAADATVLEVASGTGQHAVHVAAHLPGVTWQPTEPDAELRASIAAWIAATGLAAPEQGSAGSTPAGSTPAGSTLAGVRAPVALDVAVDPWPWPAGLAPRVDAVFCANMIHIAPRAATVGLFRGAAAHLRPGGQLLIYGPFCRGGVHTADSNAAFDQSLRARDPAWGVRDLDDLEALGAPLGLHPEPPTAMPANNLIARWRLQGRV